MKNLIALLVAVLVIGGGLLAWHFSEAQVKKRSVQESLDQFAQAVASKDRAKVGAVLTSLLTYDAKIRLEVHFFSITNARPAMEQDFDKTQFIKFIDNTLYPLTDYSYTPALQSFDEASGAVTFTSKEWADGANMMGGIAINMRYGSDSTCEGKAVFENKTAKLAQANCRLQFRQVPKPGQQEKFTNAATLQDLLK